MAKRRVPVRSIKDARSNGKKSKSPEKVAPSISAAAGGIKTSPQLATVMSLLVADVLSGRVDPRTATAACNATGKLLKVVDMQYRYGGRQPSANTNGELILI